MDSIFEYERDRIFQGLHNAAVNHQQGVNGKIAGNLEAFTQIKDAAILLHGPKGCAYHYRYYARRRWLPAYEVESDDLSEAEVIAGGEEKLLETSIRLIEERRPGCLVLIPTVSSDIMQSDLSGVARQAAHRTGCPVLFVRSEVFSHIDKSANRASRRGGLKSWGKTDVPTNTDSRGCGFSEAMLTISEQLMKPQETIPGTVNVEGYAWGYGGRVLLEGMDEMLRKLGFRLLYTLPHASTEEIARAPAAQLNIARRVRWAKSLKERFGTPFLHVHNFARYTGIEGIVRFYTEIAERLGSSADVGKMLAPDREAACRRLDACARAYGGKRILLIPRTIATLPNQIVQAVLGASIPVTDIAVTVEPAFLRQFDYDEEMVNDILANARRAMDQCGVRGELVLNPDEAQLRELTQSADLVIADSNAQAICSGKPILSEALLSVAPLDFENLCRHAEYLAGRADSLPPGGTLLINRIPFEKGLFPQLDRPASEMSRVLWQRLWQSRGREA